MPPRVIRINSTTLRVNLAEHGPRPCVSSCSCSVALAKTSVCLSTSRSRCLMMCPFIFCLVSIRFLTLSRRYVTSLSVISSSGCFKNQNWHHSVHLRQTYSGHIGIISDYQH